MAQTELKGDAETGLEDAVVITHGDGTQEVIPVPVQPEAPGSGSAVFVILSQEQMEQIADMVLEKMKKRY